MDRRLRLEKWVHDCEHDWKDTHDEVESVYVTCRKHGCTPRCSFEYEEGKWPCGRETKDPCFEHTHKIERCITCKRSLTDPCCAVICMKCNAARLKE